MRLILTDPNPGLCDAWRRHFRLGTGVQVRQGIFQDVTDADVLVTAANSFGLMDGGVDLAVARAFPGVEGRVQDVIRRQFRGELNVGDALVLDLVDANPDPPTYRYLVYAPTMRVPMDIRGTDNVYRAMWAALLRIGATGERVVIPGLGTGAGRVPFDEAARQMALAWRNFNAVPEGIDWPSASARHHEIAGTACCAGAR